MVDKTARKNIDDTQLVDPALNFVLDTLAPIALESEGHDAVALTQLQQHALHVEKSVGASCTNADPETQSVQSDECFKYNGNSASGELR